MCVYIDIYIKQIFSDREYKTKLFRMKQHTQVVLCEKSKTCQLYQEYFHYWQTDGRGQGWKGDIHHLNPGSDGPTMFTNYQNSLLFYSL